MVLGGGQRSTTHAAGATPGGPHGPTATGASRPPRRHVSGAGRARLALVALALAALLASTACQGMSLAQDVVGSSGGASEGPQVSLVSTSPSPPTLGTVEITIALASATGQPISGAKLRLEADMAMAGMKPETGDLTDLGNGRYQSHGFAFSMGGSWILTVQGTLPDGTTIDRTVPLPRVGGWTDP